MPDNRHATVVLLGDRGVMITGESGAGKSTLAAALIARFRSFGAFACLVADDQVLLRARGKRALASVPGPIAGLIEVYGSGPLPIACEHAAVVDLVVDLVAGAAPRLNEARVAILPGITLPLLTLSGLDVAGAVNAVTGRLGGDIFATAGMNSSAGGQNSLE